jgi:hypothetical protein
MEMEKLYGKMAKAMKVNIWMIKSMERVLLFGVVERNMLGVGNWVNKMDLVYKF